MLRARTSALYQMEAYASRVRYRASLGLPVPPPERRQT